jgi:hypothetical protein
MSFTQNLFPLAWRPGHYTRIAPHALETPQMGRKNALRRSKVRWCAGKSPRRISNITTLITLARPPSCVPAGT